ARAGKCGRRGTSGLVAGEASSPAVSITPARPSAAKPMPERHSSSRRVKDRSSRRGRGTAIHSLPSGADAGGRGPGRSILTPGWRRAKGAPPACPPRPASGKLATMRTTIPLLLLAWACAAAVGRARPPAQDAPLDARYLRDHAETRGFLLGRPVQA